MIRFQDYADDIFQFFRNNGVQVDPIPSIKFDKTENKILDPLISTGNYNPLKNTITLFVKNRQLKDILRSFCHELIHHNQRLTYGDERFLSINTTGNLVDNKELEDLESDAYLRGNIMFRKWTEQYRGNRG